MPSAPYTHRARVRFSDTDMMGHVNHARFLAFLEDARIGLLRRAAAAGGDLTANGCILAHLDIDYRVPLTFSDDEVVVDVTLAGLGTKSVSMTYRLSQGGETCATASTVLVAYDYAAGGSRELTAQERNALLPLVPG